MSHIVEVENLRKNYGSHVAVNDISFTVKAGTIFGFLGKNGAGKTTTIKSLTGQLFPTSGKIQVMGFDVNTDIKSVHQHIGIVSENQNLYNNFTVFENIDFFRQLYNIKPERTNEIIEILKLQDKANTRTSKLSKGLKQRVLLARSILHSPKLLFLDEPTSGLDPASSLDVQDFILEMKNNGTTVFLTTHYMEEADFLCDHVLFITEGKIQASGVPSDLKKKHGKNQIELKYRTENEVVTELLDSDCDETYKKIMVIRKEYQILSIHSLEATLKEVFLKVTGEEK
ncbi:ABC transporter ATP-binding protein [bacterium]|nr:ABC transporter ATP-binding protein [bacterium]